MNSPLRVAGICTAGETGAQRSEATAQAPQLARAEATTHVQPVTLGPDSSPHHVPGREGAHLWMVEVFTVLLDRNLQNNRSKGLLPNSHTVLLWPGQLSPTDTRRSAPGAVPPPFCWSSSGCTHVRVRVCLCVCICVREGICMNVVEIIALLREKRCAESSRDQRGPQGPAGSPALHPALLPSPSQRSNLRHFLWVLVRFPC